MFVWEREYYCVHMWKRDFFQVRLRVRVIICLFGEDFTRILYMRENIYVSFYMLYLCKCVWESRVFYECVCVWGEFDRLFLNAY